MGIRNREQGEDRSTEPTVHLRWNEHAIRRAVEVLRAAHLDIMAADVEAQLPKASVEEPTEFGSVVAASVAGRPAPVKWHMSPMNGKHYWESEFAAVELWSELRDVDVLRVGIGEPASEVAASALKLAEIRMFGTVDGDLLSDESELPVGELRRLLWTADADDITPWEIDGGLPAPSAAEAVEADKDGFCSCYPDGAATDCGIQSHREFAARLAPEPSPVQVEAGVSRNLADYRTPAEQAEWEANQAPGSPQPVQVEDEPGCKRCGEQDCNDCWPSGLVAGTGYLKSVLAAPAEDDPIEALVQGYAVHTFNVDRPGRETLFREFAAEHAALLAEVGGQQPGVPAPPSFGELKTLIDEFAQDIKDVGGEWSDSEASAQIRKFLVLARPLTQDQPGVPVEKVRALVATLRRDATKVANGIPMSTLALDNRAADLAELLPGEPTS
jgi:hypothetical protein